MRILALVVDTPSIQNPQGGIQNVQLTPYVSDIGGTGDLKMTVQSCLDRGVSQGLIATCENEPTASLPQEITISSAITSTEGFFGSPERTGSPQSGAITVPLNIPENLFSNFSNQVTHNGLSYLIIVELQALNNPTQKIKSFRRVLLTTQVPNLNPVINEIKINGTTLTGKPFLGSHELSFDAVNSPDQYTFLNSIGEFTPLTETYETSWFVSDGTIISSRSNLDQTVTWDFLEMPSLGFRRVVVVGVLRDGRGGIAVKVKTLQ